MSSFAFCAHTITYTGACVHALTSKACPHDASPSAPPHSRCSSSSNINTNRSHENNSGSLIKTRTPSCPLAIVRKLKLLFLLVSAIRNTMFHYDCSQSENNMSIYWGPQTGTMSSLLHAEERKKYILVSSIAVRKQQLLHFMKY